MGLARHTLAHHVRRWHSNLIFVPSTAPHEPAITRLIEKFPDAAAACGLPRCLGLADKKKGREKKRVKNTTQINKVATGRMSMRAGITIT